MHAGKRLFGFSVARGVAAVVALALLLPGLAVAGPAADEYLPSVSKPGGSTHLSEGNPPSTRADALPESVREQLEKGPADRALLRAATATELGAPERLAGGRPAADAAAEPAITADDSSITGAAKRGLTDESVLLVALGVVAIAAFFIASRMRDETGR